VNTFTTTDAEPSPAVHSTASAIPTITAAASEGENISRRSSPAPLPPPVPKRAARRVAPEPSSSPKQNGSGEKASGKASRASGEHSRLSKEQLRPSEGPNEEVQPATEAEIKAADVDDVKYNAVEDGTSSGAGNAKREDTKPKPPSGESASPVETTEVAVTSSPSKPVHPPRRAPPPTLQSRASLSLDLSHPCPTPSQAPATPEKSSSLNERHSLSNGHNDAAGNGANPSPNPIENGTYVGEATWEERTWKTLVRLKEDMFWARIGGVR